MVKASNSLVIIHDDFVEKFSKDPQGLAIKYSEVHRISSEFSFVAPRVLDVMADRVILDRLKNIVPISEFYIQHSSNVIDHLAQEAGAVLARLHEGFRTDLAVPWVPTDRFDYHVRDYLGYAPDYHTLPTSVLHCDYSFANIFVQCLEAPRIAVIDPCANFGSTFADWTSGPIHIDLGKMLSCFEGQIPARRQLQRPCRRRIAAMQRTFLDGYEEVSGTQVDVATAHAFAYAVACVQFHRRFGALGHLHATFLYNRLRGNYPIARRLHGT